MFFASVYFSQLHGFWQEFLYTNILAYFRPGNVSDFLETLQFLFRITFFYFGLGQWYATRFRLISGPPWWKGCRRPSFMQVSRIITFYNLSCQSRFFRHSPLVPYLVLIDVSVLETGLSSLLLLPTCLGVPCYGVLLFALSDSRL